MEDSAGEKQRESRVRPRIEIFGEEVGGWRRRRDGRGIFGGIALLLIGGLLLLGNLGFLSAEFWGVFWPVFLILIGIRFMLGNSLAARIVMLIFIIAILVFIILYDRHFAAGFSFPGGSLFSR